MNLLRMYITNELRNYKRQPVDALLSRHDCPKSYPSRDVGLECPTGIGSCDPDSRPCPLAKRHRPRFAKTTRIPEPEGLARSDAPYFQLLKVSNSLAPNKSSLCSHVVMVGPTKTHSDDRLNTDQGHSKRTTISDTDN